MLKSGVHATIAGVILGNITPAKSLGLTSTFIGTVQEALPTVRDSFDKEDTARDENILGRIEELARQTESPLGRLERMVYPWVAYLVLPIYSYGWEASDK